jgi:hypothetical protein
MEGRAEARSDLYALGAMLLAAWKGQVPFAGMTPGEMIRRKQEKLDTAGVPEPLKALIDWLTEPVLAHRAPSAAAVVEQVGKVLKGPAPDRTARSVPPTRTPTRSDMRMRGQADAPKKRRGGMVALLLLLLLSGGGGAAWYAGLLGGVQARIAAFFEEPLPVASPYAMAATAGGGLAVPKLTSHAPDDVAAEAIRQGFATLAGKEALADAVTLAQGMPSEDWALGAASVFAAAQGLEGWRIEISDQTAGVSGIAPSAAQGEAIRAALQNWADVHGFDLKTDVLNGPRVLPVEVVQEVLDGLASCGPLQQLDAPSSGYPMGATITVTGDAMEPDLDDAIMAALAGVIGDRKVRVQMNVLNIHLCTIRGELPDLPTNALSLWFGQGDTMEANLTGVYGVGDNPVVEVLIPASITDAQLWVVAVDSGGTVFNVLPNANAPETDIAKLGVVEGGTRRIRVLHTIAENAANKRLLAMAVNDNDFGKSEFIAFLTKDEMFSTRRPGQESVASLAQALVETQAERPGNIIGFASRILESRP